MTKSPGQKAYEAAVAEGEVSDPAPWDFWGSEARASWERIAAAVIAPEPPSYGEVLESAYGTASNRGATSPAEDWSTAALALIAEFKRREGIK